jgi:hypothetical protein
MSSNLPRKKKKKERKKERRSWHQWLMSIILATLQAKIRRIVV